MIEWLPIKDAPHDREILLGRAGSRSLYIGEWHAGLWRTTETSSMYGEPIDLDPNDRHEAPTHFAEINYPLQDAVKEDDR